MMAEHNPNLIEHALDLARRTWDRKAVQPDFVPMSTPIGKRWHLVRAMRYHDEDAEKAVAELGMETFRPCERKETRHARKIVVVERNLFGALFFTRFDPEADNWPLINRLLWVDRIMRSKEGFMRVPDGAIALLRQELELGTFDLTRKDAFLPGTKVLVNNGPFNGFIGEVVRAQTRKEKAEILLTMLGQVCRVKIEALHLEPA